MSGSLYLVYEYKASADASKLFFWLGAAWVKSRAERPSVSEVN